MYISNLSNSEYIRLNDITDERIIRWAESDDDITNIKSTVIDSASEAHGCFPAEDELTPLIELVRTLSVRGDNLTIKNSILTLLEEKQNELFQSGEYGKEKLDQLVNACNK